MATAPEKTGKTVQALASCALFAGVDQRDYPAVLEYLDARLRSYGADDLLVCMGNRIVRMGVVVEGSVEIGFYDEAGVLANVAHMFPGEVFGESIACAQVPAPVQVKACGPCAVLWVSAERIMRRPSLGSPQQAEQLGRNLMGLLARKNVFLNGKVHILAQKRLRDRIKIYLMGSGSNKELSRSELAQYLCVDRSALSRELGRMRDEGILRLDGKKITVLDEGFLSA